MSEDLDLRAKTVMIRVLDIEFEPGTLTGETELAEIGVNSLSLLELIVQLENEFGIHVEDADVFAAELKYVRDVVMLVRNRLPAAIA